MTSEPRWTEDRVLSEFLGDCQRYILSFKPSSRLKISPSLRLDTSWNDEGCERSGLGVRRAVVCEKDVVKCAGCSKLVPAFECTEGMGNIFSCSKSILVCDNCSGCLTF